MEGKIFPLLTPHPLAPACIFPCSSFFPPSTIHVKIDTLFYTPMKCAYYTVSFVPHYLWSPHSKIDPRAFIWIIRLSNFHLKTSIFNREAWINNHMCKLIVQQIHWDTSVSQILIHSFNSPFETDWSAFVVSMLYFLWLINIFWLHLFSIWGTPS